MKPTTGIFQRENEKGVTAADWFADQKRVVRVRAGGGPMGMGPNYLAIKGQTFSTTKLSLDNHVCKNCATDDCDIYCSGGQYKLLETHITNSRLILNHPANGMYGAVQIFKMKPPGSQVIFE